MPSQTLRASFRDPSGFLFEGDDGLLYRQVNRCYRDDFEMLQRSGLYADLIGQGLLVEHESSDVRPISEEAYCVIRPRRIPFISYPYEWGFSALKDAALLTLDVQLRALNRDMQLKDASAYNVQFEGYRPLLIDTLSFERLEADKPWKAYGQFCRHFLAPLALMAKTHIDCGYLLRDCIDGVPLDVASSMLPLRSRFSFGMQLHVHWHARMVAKHQATKWDDTVTNPANTGREIRMPKHRLQAYLENLQTTVDALRPKIGLTEWGGYYEDNSYSAAATKEKQQIVERYLRQLQPSTVWDLGANTGKFSRIASELGAYTCAFDIDPACVEQAYRDTRTNKLANFLPLRMDLSNPSPALGWGHAERDSLAERGPADTILALALIHHLAISNNVPLRAIAKYFRQLGRSLIIEFVPKEDPQAQRLLRNRHDVFSSYHVGEFEAAFSRQFEIADSAPIGTDGRKLYLMRGREA
jgi:ribosomal protein L11 methylase PrmA